MPPEFDFNKAVLAARFRRRCRVVDGSGGLDQIGPSYLAFVRPEKLAGFAVHYSTCYAFERKHLVLKSLSSKPPASLIRYPSQHSASAAPCNPMAATTTSHEWSFRVVSGDPVIQ